MLLLAPPSAGSVAKEHGHQRQQLARTLSYGRTRSQRPVYSLGLTIPGGLNAPNIPQLSRFLLLCVGFACVLLSFVMAGVFRRVERPGYLRS